MKLLKNHEQFTPKSLRLLVAAVLGITAASPALADQFELMDGTRTNKVCNPSNPDSDLFRVINTREKTLATFWTNASGDGTFALINKNPDSKLRQSGKSVEIDNNFRSIRLSNGTMLSLDENGCLSLSSSQTKK